MIRSPLCIALSFALCAPVAAQTGLPDEPVVQQALDEHPSVLAARARLEAARARASGLRAGPHEITVHGGYARRDVRGGDTFDEYNAELSRSFRLPGKARLDREIGRFGIDVAENLAEDARHEAALLLHSYWFDWLAAAEMAQVDRAAVANYETALASVERLEQLREASRLDVDRAAAALADARRTLEQSNGLALLARSRLAAHFPAMALPPEAPEVPHPEISEGRLAQLRDLVIGNSHVIAAAQAEAERMAAVADRADRDRFADPTVGLRTFSEFDGIERGAGVFVSIPLGGGHRRAVANEASASASAARAEEQLIRVEVEETAQADLAEARYRIAAWQRSRETVEAQMAALTKLRRGRQLGEIDLTDQLLGERMVHDAFRIEAEARVQAVRAITRLRIDSHDLWLAD